MQAGSPVLSMEKIMYLISKYDLNCNHNRFKINKTSLFAQVFEHVSHVSFNESQLTDDESDESIGIDD